MKPFCKTVILSCAFISCALFSAAAHAHAAAEETAKVQVNDTLVEFPDAQPFIDEHTQLQVPLRLMSETLGLRVDWSMEGTEVKVSMKNDHQTVTLKSGDSFAIVNGNKVKLESKVTFRQGRVYVPLRFVTETLGSRVQWDHDNRIAIIDADGKYHAPAWYAPDTLNEIVQLAQSFLGVRYVWGGISPEGFDCSGFVRYIYSRYGVDLPRTSRDMYDNSGSAVSDPKPGDLVFFSKGNVSHVGIYLGDGRFISATTSNGVHVDSLSSKYWSSRYIGAKSIL